MAPWALGRRSWKDWPLHCRPLLSGCTLGIGWAFWSLDAAGYYTWYTYFQRMPFWPGLCRASGGREDAWDRHHPTLIFLPQGGFLKNLGSTISGRAVSSAGNVPGLWGTRHTAACGTEFMCGRPQAPTSQMAPHRQMSRTETWEGGSATAHLTKYPDFLGRGLLG